MSLSQLEVLGFRNIQQAVVVPSPGVNGFFGSNGSGKTSLLESIYLLGNFRSFRAQNVSTVISRDADFVLVRGTMFSGDQLAVQRFRDKKSQLRLNQEPVVRSSTLAEFLPTIIFDPTTIQLLLGEPDRRRRFLNWGLFHVKPQFAQYWRDYSRALKQRNELLRSGQSSPSLLEWTRVLAELSFVIDDLRQGYVSQLQVEFLKIVDQMGGLRGLRFEYNRGWAQEADLESVLATELSGDLARGYSQKGVHRSDLKITVEGRSIAEHCSRGEAKLLAWALCLAQLSCLPIAIREKTILLIDDLSSEIDPDHGELISRTLVQWGLQIFTTGTERGAMERLWGEKLNGMFHVKQGIIEAIGGY
ncbi:MAG: DNA replication/repair protein RecF [Pseudomonadales bacterium]